MLYDITPSISARLAVWPGDTPCTREVLMEIARGHSVTLSTLHATVHLGAHADAPSHYGEPAPSIDQRPLELYLGPCQVIRIEAEKNGRIAPGDVTVPIVAPRVLFRTGTYLDPQSFAEDFASFTPELIDFLAGCGVRLVGLDTPSVDPFSSKTLDVHRRILKHDMAILEGLVLDDVPAGEYELIALPLKLVGFDASPVRAVLRTLPRPGD